MEHNGILVVLSLVFQLPLALGVALLLNRRMRGRGLPADLLRPVRPLRGGHGRHLPPAAPTRRARRRGPARHGARRASFSSGSPISASSSTRSSSSSRGSTSDSRSSSSSRACRASPTSSMTRRRWTALRVGVPAPRCRFSGRPSGSGPSLHHRIDPALRHRLDHDAGRPGRRVLDDGDLHGRPGVNSYRIGYATSVAVILFAVCFVFSILYQVFVLRRDVRGSTTRSGRMSGAQSRPAAPRRSQTSRCRRAPADRDRARADRVRRAAASARPARSRPTRSACPIRG